MADSGPAVPLEDRRFVGRQREFVLLDQLLGARVDGGARAVTVIGPSGIGKTELVRRWSRDAAGRFAAVAFCDLSNARTGDDIVGVVAAVLGLHLARGKGDGRAELARAIAGQGRLLLVLDNAEYAAKALAGLLRPWLERAPEARFLITSLLRLGLEAERILELPPLGLDEAVEL